MMRRYNYADGRLPVTRKPRYSAELVGTVYSVFDHEFKQWVSINGKCGWGSERAARNALSHLLGADHDRLRFEVIGLGLE